ncbi:MAG: hypothetical protein PWQ09_648 [Candidatus Cloacimonadota bacterium]|jgi:hypothetical protein|nr:hypothetical protein [Candidatus Cloacimonadota bacterium]
MKKLFIFLLLTWNIVAFALQIINNENVQQLDLHKIDSQYLKTVSTMRENQAETWRGVPLNYILPDSIEFSKIVLSSPDGYQVELAKEEAATAILALFEDERKLEYENRLVVPRKREMFWIKEVTKIELKNKAVQPPLRYITIAENWLKNFSQPHALPPFVKDTGYYFQEVAKSVLLFTRAEYLLIASDGVQHNLSYQNYLQNAILSQNGNGFDMKSPDMPSGMWLKKIGYIRTYDRAMVFVNQLQNWQDLQQLTKLPKKPKRVVVDGNSFSFEQFKDLSWENCAFIQLFY